MKTLLLAIIFATCSTLSAQDTTRRMFYNYDNEGYGVIPHGGGATSLTSRGVSLPATSPISIHHQSPSVAHHVTPKSYIALVVKPQRPILQQRQAFINSGSVGLDFDDLEPKQLARLDQEYLQSSHQAHNPVMLGIMATQRKHNQTDSSDNNVW